MANANNETAFSLAVKNLNLLFVEALHDNGYGKFSSADLRRFQFSLTGVRHSSEVLVPGRSRIYSEQHELNSKVCSVMLRLLQKRWERDPWIESDPLLLASSFSSANATAPMTKKSLHLKEEREERREVNEGEVNIGQGTGFPYTWLSTEEEDPS